MPVAVSVLVCVFLHNSSRPFERRAFRPIAAAADEGRQKTAALTLSAETHY